MQKSERIKLLTFMPTRNAIPYVRELPWRVTSVLEGRLPYIDVVAKKYGSSFTLYPILLRYVSFLFN